MILQISTNLFNTLKNTNRYLSCDLYPSQLHWGTFEIHVHHAAMHPWAHVRPRVPMHHEHVQCIAEQLTLPLQGCDRPQKPE